MRAVWGGFALGVIGLQQQAVLPSWRGWLAVIALAVASLAWAVRLRVSLGSFSCTGDRWRAASGWAGVWIAAACVGFGYAAWRADVRLARALPAAWEARELTVSGYLASGPSLDANGARFLFAVEAWTKPEPVGDARLPATIQLLWPGRDAPLPALEPGMRWRLPVRLKRPHGNGNFGLRDAEVAMLERDVRATGYVSAPRRAARDPRDARGLGVAIERVRWRVHRRIDAVLADAPHRGIVVALATGAQDAVTDADWRLMRRTGTTHLIAISGLHLAFVAALAGGFAGAVWRRLRWRGRPAPLIAPAQTVALWSAVIAAIAYAALAGFNVPVQRALWMLLAAALALATGRNVARSQTLGWALGLVLLNDPWAVASAGFWLSFCAVGAILFVVAGDMPMRHHDRSFHDDDAQRGASHLGTKLRALCISAGERMRRSARVQYAVTLALAPITLYWFAQMPLIGPLANAFAIPWVSALVTPAVLAGIVLPKPLDAFALHAAHRLFELLAMGLDAVAKPSWAVLHLAQPGPWALGCAALGIAWCLAPRGWPLRWAAPVTWLPLLLPAPFSMQSTGAFRVTALDVGQGTSVLVETARHALLFDAGPGPESTHAGERIVVPYLHAHGVRRLDALMISHDDSDHAGGAAAVLDEIRVDTFVGGLLRSHPLWDDARGAGAAALQCAAGQHWQWDGVDFDVLWPDAGPLSGKPNEHCCVLRVSTHARAPADPADTRVAALLAADIEAPAERALLARDSAALHAQVLVVPHHGSRTSSTEPFLDAVGPLVAIFQVGYLNRFHHPQQGVYARYEARHITLARSDADGAVRVEASGTVLNVERYRDTQRRYWMTPPE
ncbi:DNA internalization-related competence protein ComEC/Rec2 [Paraburkholderia caballeronis]|uniref:Competence protein ComEC n=1 Tax=Paraburkholderia caballeronis TaxID=416943 RepID=A0A1H7N5P2_9BURK|nr:DNA internalization-related competence protein ComEC/Rec2 [Paraburkholderia caballeronis]PXW26276.1 competence protein ComEC [Paraburkholderia caballeronis]PXX01823.1 competence protein ComEC [Paraburkholderia caballeronis]RAK00980.1 competence protein ComEC [Paraburkholderia caballeronis]SEC04844.1 competence protein ComEC [Paraburkholderia caballeronis]SEL18338.1 competence protein ComEC [Paraburkholderia caballeronis]